MELRDNATNEVVPRCPHCNMLGFRSVSACNTHTAKCKFAPRVRRWDSLLGRGVQDQRPTKRQAESPSIEVADYDGKLHTLGGKAKEVWLGHLNTCTGKTEPDVERRIQLSNHAAAGARERAGAEGLGEP